MLLEKPEEIMNELKILTFDHMMKLEENIDGIKEIDKLNAKEE